MMAGFVAQHAALKRSVRHLHFVAMHFRRTSKNIRTSHSCPKWVIRDWGEPQPSLAMSAMLPKDEVNSSISGSATGR